MKITSQKDSGDYLLIETREGVGRVWDRISNELYPEQDVEAIAKFGYWQPYTGSESAEAIVKAAQKPSFTNPPS